MDRPQIILDTNVLVSGLRSNRGASYRLLDLVGRGLFNLHLSVPLVFEYEDVLKAGGGRPVRPSLYRQLRP